MRTELHWDRVMRCYPERPANVDAMFRETVGRSPQAEAVVDGTTRLTYAELETRVQRVAGALAARGAKSGDRVALILDNRFEALVALLATLRLGAIVVPIGTRLRKPEIAYILADAEPVALIHEASLAGELPEGDALQRVLEATAGLTRYEAENAFSLSLVRHQRIEPQAVWELKSQMLKKSGLLTLHRAARRSPTSAAWKL